MSLLSDLLPVPELINLGRGTLAVRGLSLQELIALASRHKQDYAAFFNGEDIDMATLAVHAPQLIAEAIGLATDKKYTVDELSNLPVGVQVEMVSAIWKLTVPDLKKLGDLFTGVIAGLKLAQPPAAEPQKVFKPIPNVSSPKA